MESLVSRMPPGLQKLDLRFRWCSANEGAQVLAKRLPSTLTDLALAFRGCGLGEAGARALARALPQGLRSLRLSLRGCPVGVAGAEALGQRLPQSLEALTLDFRDCRLPQRGCAALAAKLPELRALHLLLGGCDLVAGDLKVLTSLLPRSVRDLHLGPSASKEMPVARSEALRAARWVSRAWRPWRKRWGHWNGCSWTSTGAMCRRRP